MSDRLRRTRHREAAVDAATTSTGVRTLAGSVVGLGVWFYLQLCILLAGWIGLLVIAAGWSPAVVTGQSMSPSLNPGDVILLSPDVGDVADGAVITYQDPSTGETITHRVVGRDADGLRTKGDANVEADPRPVPLADVDGVARIVVPLLGLPVVWLDSSQWTFLGAWLIVTLLALVVVGLDVANRTRRLETGTLGVSVTAQPLRRARTIVALVLIGQLLVDPDSLSVVDGPTQTRLLIIGIIAVIGAVNFLSWRTAGDDRDPVTQRRIAMAELAIDSVVVLLLTVPGAGGPTWVLLAFPVVEAATRFRIRGALAHWAGLLVARIFITGLLSASEPSEVINRLDAVVQQSGVLLLVAVPGAYLAEQLLADIGAQRAAAGEASRRSDLLGTVALAAGSLTKIGADIPRTIVDATQELGFDAVDVCWRKPGGEWTVLASAGALPSATKATPLLTRREFDDEILVDGIEPGSVLGQYGLVAMSIHLLARNEQGDAVLRAAGAAWPTDVEQEAVRLLAAQARVALRNEGVVTTLRETNEELVDRAVTDHLTGLRNRAGLLRDLESAVAMSEDGERVALLFLDLDGFKAVNDTYGHDAGDRLLIEVGDRLIEVVGHSGTVGRMGGDEFVVVLPKRQDKTTVETIADVICAHIAAPYPEVGSGVRVSASIGIAHGGQTTDVSTLTQRADAAMFAAKRAGKSQWCWYDPSMDVETIDPRRVALEAALARHQIERIVHPILDGDRVVAVAPAPRWSTPAHGDMDTSRLIAVADEVGLGAQLAETILADLVHELSGAPNPIGLVVDGRWRRLIGDSADQVLRRLERDSDGLAVTILSGPATSTDDAIDAFQGLGPGRARVSIGPVGSGADWTWSPHTSPIDSILRIEASR